MNEYWYGGGPQTNHEVTNSDRKENYFSDFNVNLKVVIVLTIIVLSFRDERIKNHNNYNSDKYEINFDLMSLFYLCGHL